MFRIIFVVALFLALVSVSLGQTVYSLTPETKGNQIALTIANASSFITAEQVAVVAGRHPAYVTFTSTPKDVLSIASTSVAQVVFGFDVGRVTTTSRQDTLEFLVSDKSGLTWSKSIFVQYAGPATFALDQNFPNPFNPATIIQYQLPTDSRVTLKVYDMLGREVATPVNEDRPAGYYDAKWDASNVSSGVYFYRIEARPATRAQGFQQVKKLMVVK